MKKFKKIYIEITNVCNLKCSFCPPTKRPPEYMTPARFNEILEKVKGYGEYVYLHVKGEPMMHPDFKEIVRIAGEKGFKLNITTNGTYLNELKDFIIQSKGIRQINISLHSHSKEEGIDNDKYLEEVLNFTKKARENGSPIVALRLWNMSENNDKNRESNKNQESLKKIEELFGLEERIENSFIKGKGIQLADTVFLNFETKFQWPDMENTDLNTNGYCLGLSNQIGILVDGTVVPCCLDENGEIKLGNIFAEDFDKIISSERAMKLLAGFKTRQAVEGLCARCSFKNRF